MRTCLPLALAVALIAGGCGLEETGKSGAQAGGTASAAGEPELGGGTTGSGGSLVTDAAFGGGGGTTAGAGGSGETLDAGSDTSASGGAPPLDCKPYPNAKGFVLPTGQAHCYWMNNAKKVFADARLDCQAQNGYLATIHSMAENEFVWNVALPAEYVSEEVWLNGSDGLPGDDDESAVYTWLTGEPWTFEHWKPSEPNVYCETCSDGDCKCEHRLVIDLTNGGWNDRWASLPQRFVCEAGAQVE